MVTHVGPGEDGAAARRKFRDFTKVFMRNAPRVFWDAVMCDWHGFYYGYIRSMLLALHCPFYCSSLSELCLITATPRREGGRTKEDERITIG
jgi:hypothetical protein